LATVGERVTLMDEGPGCCMLPAMTSASRISDTADAVVDLDRTQRSCGTTRLKCVTMEAVGDRIAVAAATLGGSMARSSRLTATGAPPYLCAGLMMSVRRSSSPARTPMSVIRGCCSADGFIGFRVPPPHVW
jgi:hypothetical protein